MRTSKTQQRGRDRKVNNKRKKTNNKKQYRIKNWSEYNESLKQRGSLEVWIDNKALESWHAEPTHKQGSQPVYSDLAIKTTLQFGKVFGQRLRQTEGLVNSIFSLMNINLDVPDYSTLSRRSSTIKVKLPKNNQEKKLILVVDSSGLKVYEEGEWKVRQHGKSKRRTWRKIHLAITPRGEVRAVELTENNVSDDEAVLALLEQEDAPIEVFVGDGAFAQRKVYDKCQEKGISKILIPPREDAKIWQHGNSKCPPHPRDENLRQIRRTSRQTWKETVGYHIRSLSETGIFRYKTIFGDKLRARNLKQQMTEVLINASILNKMTELGMPETYVVNAAR